MIKKLKKVVSITKSRLIEKVIAGGLYENFGQKEIRKLEDIFINISDYSEEMNEARLIIREFEEWCENYGN